MGEGGMTPAVRTTINAAEGVGRLPEEALDVGGVGPIRAEGNGPSAAGLDLPHGRARPGRHLQRSARPRRSRRGRVARDGAADAA